MSEFENTIPSFEGMVGKAVFIRTVTNYFTGRVKGTTKNNEVVLEEACWVAVTGRFGTMLVEGPKCIQEAEPYPAALPVFVNRDTIVDWFPWEHDLPREQSA